jgi:hypothetical protein
MLADSQSAISWTCPVIAYQYIVSLIVALALRWYRGDMKRHYLQISASIVSGLLFCLAPGQVFGRASTQKHPSNAPGRGKVAIRNNAASLLADLLVDEKNVSKILIIKSNSDELGKLVKAISKTAEDGKDELGALAKTDPTLNLHALQLPPGEMATRAAISKTYEHDLLLTPGGEKFELTLLLSQTNALNYGSHLAKVAADNSSSPEQGRKFHALEVALNALYEQVVAKLRALPGK